MDENNRKLIFKEGKVRLWGCRAFYPGMRKGIFSDDFAIEYAGDVASWVS